MGHKIEPFWETILHFFTFSRISIAAFRGWCPQVSEPEIVTWWHLVGSPSARQWVGVRCSATQLDSRTMERNQLERRPQSRSRSGRRDLISQLAWECLTILQKECNLCLGLEKSGLAFSVCCHHYPHQVCRVYSKLGTFV